MSTHENGVCVEGEDVWKFHCHASLTRHRLGGKKGGPMEQFTCDCLDDRAHQQDKGKPWGEQYLMSDCIKEAGQNPLWLISFPKV